MNVLCCSKNLAIALLSFFILCSCSVVNKRTEMKPIAGNGWQVKTSPATLSGWRILDFSASDHVYSQASYSCDKYKLFLNSIPEISVSLIGGLLPIYPVYYSNNLWMSIFMLPKEPTLTMVNSVADCPDVFSSKPKKLKLEKFNAGNNLCRYNFKNNQLGAVDLTLSIKDDTYHCEIEDLTFTRDSNWSYCPFCFFNIATQPVHNYKSADSEKSEISTTSTVTINSHKASGTKAGALLIGGILGGYAAYELSNCTTSNSRCALGSFLYTFLGTIGGAILGVSQTEDTTGASVNIIYPF